MERLVYGGCLAGQRRAETIGRGNRHRRMRTWRRACGGPDRSSTFRFDVRGGQALADSIWTARTGDSRPGFEPSDARQIGEGSDRRLPRAAHEIGPPCGPPRSIDDLLQPGRVIVGCDIYPCGIVHGAALGSGEPHDGIGGRPLRMSRRPGRMDASGHGLGLSNRTDEDALRRPRAGRARFSPHDAIVHGARGSVLYSHAEKDSILAGIGGDCGTENHCSRSSPRPARARRGHWPHQRR